MAIWCIPWNRHRVFRALGVLPVFLTLGLLLWSLAVFYSTVIPAMHSRQPAHAWFWGPTVTVLWGLLTWCYSVCVMRNPGYAVGRRPTVSSHGGTDRLPYIRVRGSETPRRRRADSVASLNSDDSDAGGRLTEDQMQQADLIQSMTTTDSGQPRYCHRCNAAKPDRAHHCSSCDMCVLRFDHHCPWLNACVGFHTQKAFVLFLSYATLYTTVLGVLTLVYYVLWIVAERVYDISIQCLFMMCMAFAFAISLWGFTAFHYYLTLQNLTTFETYVSNKYRVPGTTHAVQPGKVNLFDLGWRKNLRQLFGPSWRQWFVPTVSTIGDGTRFAINFETFNELQRTAT
ncbi:palmitoyltransferase for Vac8p [Coemansia spiralis]|nr:palmitoyltransferase for Vac8p [Coemansia spiralis]